MKPPLLPRVVLRTVLISIVPEPELPTILPWAASALLSISPPEVVESLAAEIPHASLVVIPRAAHLANVEHADAFNEALLAHLGA